MFYVSIILLDTIFLEHVWKEEKADRGRRPKKETHVKARRDLQILNNLFIPKFFVKSFWCET